MTSPPPPPPSSDGDDVPQSNEGGFGSPPPGNQPPQGGGYQPPQGNYPPQQGNYPPPQGNYPPSQGNYPPPQGNYPPTQGNYPPPQGNYPPTQGGYPTPPQGGYPPPPQGGYPPPPQGGYPPPPQGGYAPPPPGGYAPAGYASAGGQGFGQQGFSAGEGFSWAWNKFSKNAVPLIVPTLVYALAVGILYAIVQGIAVALAPTSTYESYETDSSFSYSYSAGLGGASIAVLVLGGLLTLIVVAAAQSAFLGGVLDIADGRPVSIGSFFKPRNITNVIIATLIVGVATSIGSALCFLPGLVVALFAIFTTVIVVDRNCGAIDGIKASFQLVKANFVPVLIVYLITVAITVVGAILCGIGLLVAVPVASLLLVFTYRKLSGGQVAPLTP
ncbi:hypothetical protein ACFQWH_27670 [Mycolicibacterium sp. GCM10028919]|uniref:hypothetical protein n=1 Tax=Mycolicibacterium sp. GCM10028919 TaxID=3273401 RepID=UPI00360624C8